MSNPNDVGASSEYRNIICMIGYLCIKDVEGLAEQVKILDLTDTERANICGSAVQSIRDARQKLKGKR